MVSNERTRKETECNGVPARSRNVHSLQNKADDRSNFTVCAEIEPDRLGGFVVESSNMNHNSIAALFTCVSVCVVNIE